MSREQLSRSGPTARRLLLTIAGVAASVAFVAPTARAAQTSEPARVATQHYSATTSLEVDPPLAWLGVESNAKRFVAMADERAVTIALADLTGAEVPFVVDGRNGQGSSWFGEAFCGHATIGVQPGAAIDVYPLAAFASSGHGASKPACPGTATSGTITATFTNEAAL